MMKEKGHFPFFDMAYQGFASGDCVRDAQAITTFLADGHELGCSQSYAKNMGLYGQRTGCFSLVVNDKSHTVSSGVPAVTRRTQARFSESPTFDLVGSMLHTASQPASMWLHAFHHAVEGGFVLGYSTHPL